MNNSNAPYFYNYFNNDVVTYSIVRLFGCWSNQSGRLSVRHNGNNLNDIWDYKHYDFKVFVKLVPGSNNIILLSDQGNGSKEINLYYHIPILQPTDSILKLYLYDSYDGQGVCDAPPSRLDNTLEDNKKRLQLNGLLLQSFFAEAYRASRETQEGIHGLPFTTFNLELSNNEPVVHYIKTTNSNYTRNYFLNPPRPGSTGLEEMVNTLKTDSRKVYVLGYTLTAHKDPVSGVYGGGIGEGGPAYGVMNGANLIWHPKSLSELYSVINNHSNIDHTYNEFDNANTVSESFSRILGSLLHEFCHHTILTDHNSQIIYLVNSVVNPNGMEDHGLNIANPLNYLFPFDVETYHEPLGIDMDDGTHIRRWFIPYETDNQPMSHVQSELGPSGKGWLSPFAVQGYLNIRERLNSGYINSNFSVNNIHNASTRLGFVNLDLLYPHPAYECREDTWNTLGPGKHVIQSPSRPTYCIAHLYGAGGGNYSSPDTSFGTNNGLGGAGGYVKSVFPVNPNDILEIVVGDTKGEYGDGGYPILNNFSYQGTFGGGKTSIYLNNNLIAVAGGGGGGSLTTPGMTVGNPSKYNTLNGDNDANLSGEGGHGGGGGFKGGSAAQNVNYGAGAGSSYVSSICTHAIIKPGINTTNQRKSTAVRRIIPSLYMKSPPNIGGANENGCAILNFIHVSESRFKYLNKNVLNRNFLKNSTDDPLNVKFNSILPRPKTLLKTNKKITLDQSTRVTVSIVGSLDSIYTSYLNEHVQVFKNDILNITGINCSTNNNTTNTISLILDTAATELLDEDNKYYKYKISIKETQPTIEIKASSVAGIAHATATILQLLRCSSSGTASLMVCDIFDYSSTIYSTILIDPARDSISFNYMKELIDLCRFYKIRFLHIHGTDDQGWCFYLDPTVTDFIHNGVNYSLQSLNYPLSGGNNWYGIKSKWEEINLYAESRGVSIVPEIEYLGHSSFIRFRLPVIFGIKEVVDHTKEVAYIALQKIIDQICITFPKSPFIYIGTDEATGLDDLSTNQDQEFFSLHPEVPRNNTNAILNFFIYRANAYIQSKNRKMITWENVNSDASYANTNKTVVAQSWHINGGNGNQEDGRNWDIHGDSLNYYNNGITVSQTTWHPRALTQMKGMFDWTVIGTTSVNQPNLIQSGGNKTVVKNKLKSRRITYKNKRGGQITSAPVLPDMPEIRLLSTLSVNTLTDLRSKIGNLIGLARSGLTPPSANDAVNINNDVFKRYLNRDYNVNDYNLINTIDYLISHPELTSITYPAPIPAPTPAPASAQGSAPASAPGSATVLPNLPEITKLSQLTLNTLNNLRQRIDTLKYLWNYGIRDGINDTYRITNDVFKRFLGRNFNIIDYSLIQTIDYLILHPELTSAVDVVQVIDPIIIEDSSQPLNTIDSNIHFKSLPLPLTSLVFGATTLLWERHVHKDKLMILRYKAPLRNENNYRLDGNSISYYNTFSEKFNYLDNRFDNYLTGFRIIEDGLSENIKEIMQQNKDHSLIPVKTFAELLKITINNNRTDTYIKYDIGKRNTSIEDLTSNISIYNSPIEIKCTDEMLTTYNHVCVRFQAFDTSTNLPVSRLVERYYRCIPFDFTICGTFNYTQLDSFRSDDNLLEHYFDNYSYVIIKNKHVNGTIKIKINDDSITDIDSNKCFKVTGDIDSLSLYMVDNSNNSVGSYYKTKFIKDKSRGTVNNINHVSMLNINDYTSFSVTKIYTANTYIDSIFRLISPLDYNSVKITVFVVGGGGTPATSSTLAGPGGMAHETYYNIPSSFGIYIRVGNANEKSYFAFDQKYEIDNNRENGNIKSYQYTTYPVIAMPGKPDGKQGIISKGDPIFLDKNGFSYNNSTYGHGNGGKGIVIVRIEAI